MSTILAKYLTINEECPGTLSFGGTRMVLLDVEHGFWALRRQMVSLLGEQLTNAVMQQAGTNGGASFAESSMCEGNSDSRQRLHACIAAYQAAGFGQLEIETLEWPLGRLVVRAVDTFEAAVARHHGQQAHEPVCAYTAGVLVGFINVIAGRHDIVCKEHTCQAQGAEACIFELLPAAAAGDSPVVAFTPDPALGQQLSMLEHLFDRTPMGIAVIDRDLRIQRFNPTWREFAFRYAPASSAPLVPGVRYFDHLPGTEPTVMPLFDRVLAGETIHKDAIPLELDDQVTYWDTALMPLWEGDQVTGILNVTVDATERVLATQALEQRVQERTHELSTLLQLSRDLNATLELPRLLDSVLAHLRAVVPYTAAAVLTLEESTLVVSAYHGPVPDKQILALRFPLAQAPIHQLVIERRQPIIIADVRSDSQLAHLFRDTAGNRLGSIFGHVRAWLSVPLVAAGRTFGILTLDHSRPGFFTPQHARLIQTFANQVAGALDNARLYQLEQQRQRELQTLLDVTATAASSLELDGMLAATLQRLVALIEASRAGVMLVDPETGALYPRMLVPDQEIAAADMVLMVTGCEAVARSGVPHYLEPDLEKDWLEPSALLPLSVRGRTLGVLVIIGSKGRAFNRRQRALFESIADQLAVAIENASLYAQAERTAAAEERSRLARELHDAVTQTLFSASLIAEVLPRLWSRDPKEGQRRLKELQSLTRGALAEMRALLIELRPAALETADLGDLLRQLVTAVSGRTGVPIKVTQDCDWEPPVEVKVALYRIAQEALNNAAKHANASQVEVALRVSQGRITLHIQDDGVGFNLEEVSSNGLGLGIMRERAVEIGARLTFNSWPHEGTSVQVEWRNAKL